MKVAIVVGHAKDDQGAVAVDGVQEWAWQQPLALQLCDALQRRGIHAGIYYRPTSGGYSSRMGKLIGSVNEWDPELVISLHFNATESHTIAGTEALHYPSSSAGKRWADILSAATAEAQGTRNRGAKPQAESWSGAPLYILRDTRAPAVILETHFGDVAGDHAAATAARDSGATAEKLAAAIAEPNGSAA